MAEPKAFADTALARAGIRHAFDMRLGPSWLVRWDTIADDRPRVLHVLAPAGEATACRTRSGDLVVFDEAHHLTAYRSGGKVKKTENYKLAEVLKGHCRDLLLLSGTPHQGDHFRFWRLIQLLDPTLFGSPADMLSSWTKIFMYINPSCHLLNP